MTTLIEKLEAEILHPVTQTPWKYGYNGGLSVAIAIVRAHEAEQHADTAHMDVKRACTGGQVTKPYPGWKYGGTAEQVTTPRATHPTLEEVLGGAESDINALLVKACDSYEDARGRRTNSFNACDVADIMNRIRCALYAKGSAARLHGDFALLNNMDEFNE